MLGWINDCVEQLIIHKHGLESWHTVKKLASIQMIDGGYVKLEHYPDETTKRLVKAAAKLSKLSEPEIYYEIGKYFAYYIIQEGYENLLCSQGSTLKDWMVNINAIHQHLQTTFPSSMVMPEFWVTKNQNGSLTLYYYSSRGNYLAPLAVGLIMEVAYFQFQLELEMEMLTKQGIDGSKFTSWMVTTKDPNDLYKLCNQRGKNQSTGIENAPTEFGSERSTCPFTGIKVNNNSNRSSSEKQHASSSAATIPYHHDHDHDTSETTTQSNNSENDDILVPLRGTNSGNNGITKSSSPRSTPRSPRSRNPNRLGSTKAMKNYRRLSVKDLLNLNGENENENENEEQPVETGASAAEATETGTTETMVTDTTNTNVTTASSTPTTTTTKSKSTTAASTTQAAIMTPNLQQQQQGNTSSMNKNSLVPPEDNDGGDGGGGGIDSTMEQEFGLSATTIGKLFPYHIVMDDEFCITQVGPQLSKILNIPELELYKYEIDEVFDFVKPKPAKWTKSWIRKLEDAGQEFVVEPTLSTAPDFLTFRGTLIVMDNNKEEEGGEKVNDDNNNNTNYDVMMILCPDAKNLEELQIMNLTLSDLPAHGSYRDSVFLREHLSRQMMNATNMEKLSKTLQTEKELLESLLPHHAAEGLRQGKKIEPMLHNNVTMFFSDIVGFTEICKTISPWQVINMLNQLYGVMDHLAKKFNLFKVETIGDAYVCCSGLPESDINHATNVANFAVAIAKYCSMVPSPLDGSPLQLRIGVHTGACASGIVGVTNPRYCVFGDTVNTTARHESTGAPGKVHCSLTTMIELMQRGPGQFNLISRGLVAMKGRGEQPTYWLEATDQNPNTGPEGMERLDVELKAKFADIGDMDGNEDNFSARHVIASPGASTREELIKKKENKNKPPRRRLISREELESDDDDDDDDDYATDSSSEGLYSDYTGASSKSGDFNSSFMSLSRRSKSSTILSGGGGSSSALNKSSSAFSSPRKKSGRGKLLPIASPIAETKDVRQGGGIGNGSDDGRMRIRSKASMDRLGSSDGGSSRRERKESHDTDLLKAIDLVESVMTNLE